MYFKIAQSFSETPGGRYKKEGPYSAEEFRDNFLVPLYLKCLALSEKLMLDFDGGYGYAPGFLEETFGGMIRLGYSATDMATVIEFVSNEEPNLISNIASYISDAEWVLNDRNLN